MWYSKIIDFKIIFPSYFLPLIQKVTKKSRQTQSASVFAVLEVNKSIPASIRLLCYFVFISLCFWSITFAQNQVGFGGSVPREDLVEDNTSIVEELYPSSIATRSFVYHLNHHKVSISEESGLLSLTRAVQLSITSDIVVLLDQAVDKWNIISDYLSDTRILLDRVNVHNDTTSIRLQLLTDAMQKCLLDKTIADRAFFDAVNTNDDTAAALWLQNALASGLCATQYRVQLNALKVQYDKLQFYTEVLQKKYDYIDIQKEYIEKYYAVLRPDLLKELTAIASSLQSFVLVK